MLREYNFWPIGTVCKLKNGQKYVMITGFCPIVPNGSKQKTYDYCGCMYPEGVVSSEVNLVFNNEQVEQIIFEGFRNDEEKVFKVRLQEIVQKKYENVQFNYNDSKDETLISNIKLDNNKDNFSILNNEVSNKMNNVNILENDNLDFVESFESNLEIM